MSIAIAERLDNIEDLPTIPHTMQQVLTEIESISASAKTLQDIIEQDPVITAKILKMANSTFYGTVVDISNVGRAMVTMGFDEVRSVVVGLSLAGVFCDDLGFEQFDATALWLHSIGVGTTAKLIAAKVNGLNPDDLFTAGMLHDLGRLVSCLYFKDELQEVLERMDKSAISLHEAEVQAGLDHAAIGAYLAKRWDLSEILVNAIQYHHAPQKAEEEYLQAASVIYLADSLSMNLEIGWTGLGEIPKVVVPKNLGLTNDKVKEIIKLLRAEKSKIISGWGNIISS